MNNILTTGMNNAIVIPKNKIKDENIPQIEYTTKFDDTLNMQGNTGVVHGTYGSMYLDAIPEFKNLKDIIVYYRIIENYPDVAKAIMHIEMEVFPPDPTDNNFINITFDEKTSVPKNTQEKIRD